MSIFPLLCAFLLLSSTVFAHNLHDNREHGVRLWQLTGKSITASFLSLHNDTILLERTDGIILRIPISKLNAEEVDYVYHRIAAIANLNRTIAGNVDKRQQEDEQNISAALVQGTQLQQWSFTEVVTGDNRLLIASLIVTGCIWFAYYADRVRKTPRIVVLLPFLGLAAVYVSEGIPYIQHIIMSKTNWATIDSSFAPFKPHITTRWDSTYFYVESNGMPTQFPPMVGITNWQQQVPIPQYYSGTNAWSIPLNPVMVASPLSTDKNLFTGAIGLAINGIPIFNAKNNRGEDSYAIGELDQWGGHCGRADDYHYHIAPLHLQSVVGRNRPIAWALDGFPVYGDLEPDSSSMKPLDANHGHDWSSTYHYHGTKDYPYMIGAMRGQVTVENDQIIPQPRTRGARPATSPLKGAAITEFVQCDTNHYSLKYQIGNDFFRVIYQWDSQNNYKYIFVDTATLPTTELYKRK